MTLAKNGKFSLLGGWIRENKLQWEFVLTRNQSSSLLDRKSNIVQGDWTLGIAISQRENGKGGRVGNCFECKSVFVLTLSYKG